MNENLENLCRGVSRAAWAYFFLYFDFNLFVLNVLPDFVCFILLWQAIGLLETEERDFALLRPLCILLGVRACAGFLLSLLGVELAFPLTRGLGLVLDAVSLYFHFQLFTDFARMARRYQREGETLDRRLLRLRAVQAVLATVVAAVRYLFPGFGAYETLLVALAILSIVAAVMLMLGLFALRQRLRERLAAHGS